MSTSWATGSSRAWRQVRRAVLFRDDFRCRIPGPDGRPCLAPANHVDHITPRSLGGALLDPANCRAACRSCNLRRGAGARPKRAWSWT